MSQRSIIVIGAGVLGANAALRLAMSGDAQVTLIDQSDPGAGTTATSMAWLNASNKAPRDYFELNFAGLRANYELAALLGDDSWIHRTGSLVSASYNDGLALRGETVKEWGYEVEFLTGREANERYDPLLVFRSPDELVIRYRDEGWVDGRLAVHVIVERFASLGGTLLTGSPVVGIDQRAGQHEVRLGDGTSLGADVVVNAAGPSADTIAAMVGREIHMAGTQGIVLQLQAAPGLVRSMVLTGDSDARPDGASRYRVHSDAIDDRMNEGGRTRAELVAGLLDGARTLVPAMADARVLRVYSATRPMPEDGFSSIGAVRDVPGYFEMITHSGITFGPLFGRIIADQVLRGTTDPLVTSTFDPNRFSA